MLTMCFRVGSLLQKVNNLLPRNPDISAADPTRRIGQARYLRRHQVGNEVLVCWGEIGVRIVSHPCLVALFIP